MHRFKENLRDLLEQVGRGNAATALEHHPDFTPDLTERPGDNPKVRCGCGRTTQADMLAYYDGDYICDGCWTAIRRVGGL